MRRRPPPSGRRHSPRGCRPGAARTASGVRTLQAHAGRRRASRLRRANRLNQAGEHILQSTHPVRAPGPSARRSDAGVNAPALEQAPARATRASSAPHTAARSRRCLLPRPPGARPRRPRAARSGCRARPSARTAAVRLGSSTSITVAPAPSRARARSTCRLLASGDVTIITGPAARVEGRARRATRAIRGRTRRASAAVRGTPGAP